MSWPLAPHLCFSIDQEESFYIGIIGLEAWKQWKFHNLVELLAIPVERSLNELSDYLSERLSQAGWTYPPTTKSWGSQPRLASLPLDVLLEILKHLDFTSCFRLCGTSQTLWALGFPYLLWRFAQCLGQWAGTRIICIPESFREQCPLPAGFLTDAERLVILSRSKYTLDDEARRTPSTLNISHFFEHSYRYRPHHDFRSPHQSLCTALHRETRQLPEPHRQLTTELLLGGALEDSYPSDESWVLRNLTAKEFVRADTLLAAFPRSVPRTGPLMGFPGLADAMVQRVCWPPERRFGEEGAWAGHRLEICTQTRHAAQSDETWKDISREIVIELAIERGLEVCDTWSIKSPTRGRPNAAAAALRHSQIPVGHEPHLLALRPSRLNNGWKRLTTLIRSKGLGRAIQTTTQDLRN